MDERLPAGCDQNHEPGPEHTAELASLERIDLARGLLDLVLGGHLPLDARVLLLAAAVLDDAGIWCLAAERVRDAA
jgi:hypothetical protein